MIQKYVHPYQVLNTYICRPLDCTNSSLQWRHNGHDGVSNHQPYHCSTVYSDADQRKHKSSAPLAFVRGIHRCGEFTETGEFPAQMASNAENVSIWWRHHEWQTHRQLYRMTVNLFGEKYCIWIQQSYVSSEEDHIGSTCILFIENINVHDYFTRQQEKFHVPNTKRNYMQRTISYRGIIVWNHITKHIAYYRSLLSFKFALWKYVIDGDILLDSV